MCLHNPQLNWEVIFILLDIPSLTPLIACVLCVCAVHARVQAYVFVCVYCTPAWVAGKGQKAIGEASTGDGIASCISWRWTYLCPDRLSFLPAHHSRCRVVNCVCAGSVCAMCVCWWYETVCMCILYVVYASFDLHVVLCVCVGFWLVSFTCSKREVTKRVQLYHTYKFISIFLYWHNPKYFQSMLYKVYNLNIPMQDVHNKWFAHYDIHY